jgi:processive 1,2-diacylglycerol beta-glucosyltransferase
MRTYGTEMPLRMLILSVSAGAGHVRAAQAVELAARELHPDAEIRNVDVMTLTNAGFRRIYAQAYIDIVNKAPHLMGHVYDLFDRARGPKDRREWLRRTFQKLNLRKLSNELSEGHWDVAVCTHFLPAEIIAELRRSGSLAIKQVVVTTDFDTHRMWANEPAEAYTCATHEGKLHLAHWGVDPDRIHVTGIPIHPLFAKPLPRADAVRMLALRGDRPIVLQLAGGFGVGPIEELYRALLTIRQPTEFVVVCGRNESARSKLQSVAVPEQHAVTLLGFTDKMDQLMAAADIVVSKPGGLTVSEALSRGAAMAIINPTPGQETRNNDFLLENGAAVKVNSVTTLAYKVEGLLTDPPRLARLRECSRRLGTPRAAYDVVRLAERIVAGEPARAG